jgi:hypothetical protein
MKPNIGWNATASPPTVHVHGSLNSSRRNMKTNSAVAAAISADSNRISMMRCVTPFHGEAW